MKHLLTCLALLLVTTGTFPFDGMNSIVHADMVSFVSSADNTLYENATGSLSNGSGDHFFAGMNASGQLKRGLIYFDVAAMVPANATITEVTLTLHMSRTISSDITVGLHAATAGWGEGTSDAPGNEGGGDAAAPGDATWLHNFSPGSFWTNEGGDFDAISTASASVGAEGFYNWSSATMVGEVQNWLNNPSANFGWFVIGSETGISTKRFDSRENPNAAFRPSLSIEFSTVPEPASGVVCMIALITLGSARRRT